ncbi:hypothetical protein HK104_008626 [Borealophlyctis nickersoniae]|nr:hypothetical protein HK104_008626 [Borealophlyctis nickersoniae]
MSTLALDALGLSILGVDFGLLSSRSPKPSTAAPKVQKNVIQLVDAMMEGIIKRALTPRPLWGLFMRDGFQETVATLRGIVLEVIESKRREMEGRVGAGEGVHQEGGKSGDLLERILESDARNELTDDEVIDNMILMFMAGQDTSANALVVTLYYLAQHPAVLQKLEKEILDAFGADGTPQSTKELEGLRYLDAVIKESLRLFGPAPMVQRRTTRDAVLGGKWVVPKNAELLIMAHTMQTDDTYWPDAGEFKPERWLEDGGVAGKNAAYVPFAAGPFICVGMRFANVEMRLTLTRIIQRYTFTLTPNQTFTPVYTSTLGFKEGVKFDIVLRSGGRRVGMEE